MLAKSLAACTRLSTTVSQLFEPQLQKNRHFYVPRFFIFLFALGTPLWQSRKTLHEWKDNNACQTARTMYPSIFNSFPVIRTAVQKIAVFTYRSPHLCFPWRRPATITQYVAWMERQFNACQTSRSMYLSIFNSFRVIRCLNQCVSPKNRYFYHIFVSPGNAPGTITLNVVWMEREFDAYKLSRCMCPSNYNRFWDRARYWSKIVIFFIPPCIWRPC